MKITEKQLIKFLKSIKVKTKTDVVILDFIKESTMKRLEDEKVKERHLKFLNKL